MLRSIQHLQLTAAAGVLFAISACADILNIPDQPQLTDTGPWRCLREPEDVDPPKREKATVQLQACNFVSSNCSTPVTNLTASLCDKLDVDCTKPIASNITDSAGRLTAEVRTGGALGSGFDGFLRVTAPSERCDNEAVFGEASAALCGLAQLQGCNLEAPDDRCKMPTFAPAMYFFNPPVRDDFERPIPLPLVPTVAIQPILEAVGGTTIDPSTGFLFITALDCDGNPAPGVQFSMRQNQASVTQLYIDNGVVSRSANQTDKSGLAGFVHVPAGFAGIVGATTGNDTTPPETIGELGVQIAAFTITYGTLAPSR